MSKIVGKLKFSAKHEHKYITNDLIGQIAGYNKRHRQLYVLRVKYTAEFPVQVTYVHQQQCIKAQKISKKDIIQKSTEETNQKPFLLPPHKTKGGSQNDKQIWNNSRKGNAAKYTALENKAT